MRELVRVFVAQYLCTWGKCAHVDDEEQNLPSLTLSVIDSVGRTDHL